MKLKKRMVCAVMALIIAVLPLSGCKNNREADNGKVKLVLSGWPTESNKALLERNENLKKEFEKLYPHIEIVPDTWNYSFDTFLPKAASGQLPTMFTVPFTEVDKLIESGYIADITEKMEEHRLSDNMKQEVLDLVTRKGKKYFLPTSTYVMGMYANKNLFEKAELLNEDNTVKFPQTFEELVKTASIIKKKTGEAGFIMPTTNNLGGWHFTNIAWSYGVEFMKQEEGKWKATFNTPECVEALQLIKDMKWKYDILPASALIDNNEMAKLFATDRGAMYLATPPQEHLSKTYSMDKKDIAIGKIPSGPKGRYALMGGALNAFNAKATDEELEAAFLWCEFLGRGYELNEQNKKNMENSYQVYSDEGRLIGVHQYSIWKEGTECIEFENSLIKKYTNIDPKDVKTFEEFDDIIIKAEEPVSCQQLYQILDSCVQAVLTDKNADPAELIKKASDDFQKNYLDKMDAE